MLSSPSGRKMWASHAARPNTPPRHRENARANPSELSNRQSTSSTGNKNEWISPAKPIATFKMGRKSPRSNQMKESSNRPPTSSSDRGRRKSRSPMATSPGAVESKFLPKPQALPDSSDDEQELKSQSSEDDEIGTQQQQEARRARRERRRAHREFIRNIQREKKVIHERVLAAIFKCDDVMNDDLAAQKEEAQEVRQRVSELVTSYQDLNKQGAEELSNIQSWFSRIDKAQERAGKDKPAVDLDEFNVDEMNQIFHGMTSRRDTVEHKAHLIIDQALAMVNTDDSKQQLHEQRIRFVEEVNSLVKSLERVESHAKGLTQNNIDLRLQLKETQDEMREWQVKFLKVEHTKEAMVRQMETAIVQRTQALRSQMSGDSGDQVASLMDTISQMQEREFEAHETMKKLRTEILDQQVKTSMAEEEVKRLGLEMIDLRQAAGPTADLIKKLREDIDIAKRGELSVRKDLHQAKMQIKRLSGEHVPDDENLPLEVQRGVQCVLIGAVDGVDYNEDSTPSSSPTNHVRKEQVKAAVNTINKAGIPEKDEEQELEALEANMDDRDKMSSMAKRIEMLKFRMDGLVKEQQNLGKALSEKEGTIVQQKSTIDRLQLSIEQMLDSKEGQRIKIDTDIYRTHSSQRHGPVSSREARETPDTRAEKTAIRNNAGDAADTQTGNRMSKTGAADKIAVDQRTCDRQSSLSNKIGTSLLEKETVLKGQGRSMDEFARTMEREREEELESSIALPDPDASPTSQACKRMCDNAWRFHQQVVKHIIGSGQSKVDTGYVLSVLKQGSVSADVATDFLSRMFEALAEYLSTEWTEGVHKMTDVLQKANELDQQKSGETIKHMIKTRNLVETKHMKKRADGEGENLQKLEERIQQQAVRWEKRKRELKEKKAKVLMECMDSILRVVTVNFKVQIAPGVIQDIKGHMYTSLLHSSPPTRANIMLGGGLDSRPGTRILTPRAPANRPPTMRLQEPKKSASVHQIAFYDIPESQAERPSTNAATQSYEFRQSVSEASRMKSVSAVAPMRTPEFWDSSAGGRQQAPLTARESRTIKTPTVQLPNKSTMAYYNLATPRSGFSPLFTPPAGADSLDCISPSLSSWGFEAQRDHETDTEKAKGGSGQHSSHVKTGEGGRTNFFSVQAIRPHCRCLGVEAHVDHHRNVSFPEGLGERVCKVYFKY